jgi:hypothetical protein
VIDAWFGLLLIKMAIAAGIVVGCSLLAERSGPLVAAMIATLPISLGPVYVFLAMDHDAAFIAEATLGSMTSNIANACLMLIYVLLAQRYATLPSLGLGLLAWLAAVVTLKMLALPFAVVVGLTVLIFGAVHLVVRPYLAVRPAAPPERPWYAIPLRAACVALLAGTATVASSHVGGIWSGVLAGLPIVLSSLVVMLQPRMGGPVAAAVIANSVLGLLGFGLAIAAVHLTAVPLGTWPALALGLVICSGWNLSLMGMARMGVARKGMARKVMARRPRRASP